MKIGAVLCAKNEAHIIEEWVAHHLAMGFDWIHIFDNLSDDGTREKIQAINWNWPRVTCQTWAVHSDVQRSAYDQGLHIMRDAGVDWCAFLDTDEFICNPSSKETLKEMLSRHEDHAAIGLNWAIFGSGGHVQRPPGLIQESFLWRAPHEFGPNRHIKTIVRPREGLHAITAHGFNAGTYYTHDGREIEWRLPYAYTMDQADLSGWRINHYFCQWRERWDAKVERSKARGAQSVTRTEAHWIEHDRNEIEDLSALQWIERDRAVMEDITR